MSKRIQIEGDEVKPEFVEEEESNLEKTRNSNDKNLKYENGLY